MKRIILLTAVLLLLPSVVSAEDHYVTQNGGSGSMSVDDFEALDGTGYAGDTFYFSGMITTQVDVGISGTLENHVILDGHGADDTTYQDVSEAAGRAVIDPSSTDASIVIDDGGEYITIQDFEMTGCEKGIRFNDCNDILVKRNYIYTMSEGGMAVGSDAWDITIGGSSGNGNVIKNVGYNTGHEDISITGHDVIISYNHLYATDEGNLDGLGIDGVMFVNGYNVLIEYNEIHGHNADGSYAGGGGDLGEDGIDIKKTGSYNVIIRYNHIYDHDYQTGIMAQSGSHDIYIYGNRVYDNGWANILVSDVGVDDVYVFSNILYEGEDNGLVFTARDGNVKDITIYNNVIAESAVCSDFTAFDYCRIPTNPDTKGWANLGIRGGENVAVMNNILYKSRPYESSYYPYRQVYVYDPYDTISNFDYNRYYWPSQTSEFYWGDSGSLSLAGLQGGSGNGLPQEVHGSEGDPGLVDIDNKDYRIASADSAVVDSGIEVGIGNIVIVTIQGVDYPVRWDAALHPSTDWSTTPPTVIPANQNDYGTGWEQGAYVYDEGGLLDCLPPDECCSTGQLCQGGVFRSSSDCGDLCCVGGSCYTEPQTQTCQDRGFSCCTECEPGTEHPENDSDCSPQVCCGECLSQPVQGEYNYSVIKTPYLPVIDTDLSEFSDADTITVTDPITGTMGTYRLMWNEDALYIAAEFSDSALNTVNTENDSYLWQDDGLEIMFDTLNDGGDTSPHIDDYKFYASPAEVYADSQAYNLDWDTRVGYAVSVDGTVNDNGDTDIGWVVEMAIPWQDWRIAEPDFESAGFGSVWSMNIQLNDKTATDKSSTQWSGSGLSVNIPDGWNDVLFTVRADTTRDGCVHMNELLPFIDSWKYDSTGYPMWEMMEAVVLYYNPGDWC